MPKPSSGRARRTSTVRLDRLTPEDADGRLRAVIESPQDSRNKLKYEPADDAFRVTQSLPAGMLFPFDFGFIPGTMADDGDPLDVLILMDAPAYPGTIVRISLLGVIEATQQEDGEKPTRNDRLIALAEGSTERGSPRSLKDLDPLLVDQIEGFFVDYNRLRGCRFTAIARKGPRTARRLLRQAIDG